MNLQLVQIRFNSTANRQLFLFQTKWLLSQHQTISQGFKNVLD